MCRILGYLGPSISLDQLVLKPKHSMLVQSYKPKEMKTAVLNGDGFGLGWYDWGQRTGDSSQNAEAFVYRNTLPMWNDRSLGDLCRYIRAENFVVNLRSATDKMPLDLSNCQPFKHAQMLFSHNGLIENFFDTLYRPIRDKLCDTAYKSIRGCTDSEHIFALLVHHLETQPGIDLAEALRQTMGAIAQLAAQANVRVAANIILSTGNSLVALRYANQDTAPSLYWSKDSPCFPDSIIFASEPLFEGDWHKHPQGEMVRICRDLKMETVTTIE